MDNEQERSRQICIYYCYIPNWRELLFVTSLGQVQKPLYSNIQWLTFFCRINLNIMDVNKCKITDVFSGNRQYVIPFFQRAYVWWKEQWERLLIDMEHVSEVQRQYFLGSIILKQQKTSSNAQIGDVRTIIDGQQRLTTLMVFFKVYLLLTDQASLFNRNFVLFDGSFAIRHSHNDVRDFERIMKLDSLEDLDGDGRLIYAYNYFKENIRVDKLDYYAIVNNILLVSIDLNNDEDEQQIFDTINSLGVRLTTGELLKNYFYDCDDLDFFNSTWKQVFEKDEECKNYWETDITTGRLKRNNLEAFLNAYLQIKIQDPDLELSASTKKIFRKTDSLFNNYKTLILDCKLDKRVVVEELVEYAKVYKDNFELNIAEQKLSNVASMSRINFLIFVLDGTTLIPYVLYLLFKVEDDCERNVMFEYLETYIMRRIICKTSNNNYTDLFTEHLIGKNVDNLVALKEYIEDKDSELALAMPSNKKVIDAFLNSDFTNKRALGVLYLMESKMRSDSRHSTQLLPYSSYSLEHLMPSKWRRNWELPSEIDEDERNRAIKSIGNMAMITQTLNASIKNACWSEKKSKGLLKYASDLETLYGVLNLDSWDEAQIEVRARCLARKANEIWAI